MQLLGLSNCENEVTQVLLQKMIGANNMRDIDHHVAMLLLNDSPDAWRTAGPITQITDTPYPFDNKRPTAKEVRYCLVNSY